ncbi:MAG TPA: mannan-binding lectin [Methylobacter sp.]|jgi:hypothetical protein
MKFSLMPLCGAIALLASSLAMADGGSPCTISAANGNTVNGAGLWGEVPIATHSATDCDVDQFSWNNFLYLVSDDKNGHPRFMSLAPWYDAMPASGKPTWTGAYTPLKTTQLTNKMNRVQAGDDFHLLDVNGKTVAYDIRINQDFMTYIADNGMYKKGTIAKAAAEFKKDSSTAGIWLPPTPAIPTQSALEIKTSWRAYGSGDNICPSDIMHCEKDSTGNWWGLIGMHMVQKTPQHGEMIWASFEHVANSPDCAASGSNPIQKNPGSLNANKNIPGLKDQTGWNLFNYTSYQTAGGDGQKCVFPQKNGSGKPLCLTDPNPSGDKSTWISINSCRTDQLPTATNCSTATDNLQVTSCLNDNVQKNMPSSIASKWSNYRLIGAEYVFWGSTGGGAPLVGCWNFVDGAFGLKCVADKSGEISVALRGTTNLANTTMETWMQKGIDLKTASLSWTLTQQDCLSCHQPTTTLHQGDMSHLFGRAQQIGDVEAGPLYSDSDAKNKCPGVCKGLGGKWTGQWTTTVPGTMSVCGCVADK